MNRNNIFCIIFVVMMIINIYYLFHHRITNIMVKNSFQTFTPEEEIMSPSPQLSSQSLQLFPPPPPFSLLQCAESVPSYTDTERTTLNILDHLRHTCLFENLYFSKITNQFYFLTDDPHSVTIPPLSIMGFMNVYSAPTPFPTSLITLTTTLENTTIPSFTPILTMLSRTFVDHHGHTLFDGVLAIWFAMKRMNLSNDEIRLRNMLIRFHDSKGHGATDDRFGLLSSLPSLYNTFEGLGNNVDYNLIRIERMIIGFAGFGWACAPQTLEWRGQRMREFRSLAFERIGVERSSIHTHSPITILIIDRLPKTTKVSGKVNNYYSRWIYNESEAWMRLAADLSTLNVNITHATLEDTTLTYQMNLVQSASIIITLEGSAMENAPFFRDNTVLIALQYNRRWEYYYYLSARHFVEYAQFIHVKMVETRIDDSVIPIQNSGGNFGIHLHYDLVLRAVVDGVKAVREGVECDGVTRCGSLMEYTTNGVRSIE